MSYNDWLMEREQNKLKKNKHKLNEILNIKDKHFFKKITKVNKNVLVKNLVIFKNINIIKLLPYNQQIHLINKILTKEIIYHLNTVNKYAYSIKLDPNDFWIYSRFVFTSNCNVNIILSGTYASYSKQYTNRYTKSKSIHYLTDLQFIFNIIKVLFSTKKLIPDIIRIIYMKFLYKPISYYY